MGISPFCVHTLAEIAVGGSCAFFPTDAFMFPEEFQRFLSLIRNLKKDTNSKNVCYIKCIIIALPYCLTPGGVLFLAVPFN